MHPTVVTPPSAQQLRDVGLRATRPRLAVLDVLVERPHSDTATIIDAVRRYL